MVLQKWSTYSPTISLNVSRWLHEEYLQMYLSDIYLMKYAGIQQREHLQLKSTWNVSDLENVVVEQFKLNYC